MINIYKHQFSYLINIKNKVMQETVYLEESVVSLLRRKYSSVKKVFYNTDVLNKPTNISVLNNEKDTIPEYGVKCIYDNQPTKSTTIMNYIIDKTRNTGYPIFIILQKQDGYYYINSNKLYTTFADYETRFLLREWTYHNNLQDLIYEIIHMFITEEQLTYLKKLNNNIIEKKYYEERQAILSHINYEEYHSKEEEDIKRKWMTLSYEEKMRYQKELNEKRLEEEKKRRLKYSF